MHTDTFSFIKGPGGRTEPTIKHGRIIRKGRKTNAEYKKTAKEEIKRTREWILAYKLENPCVCGESDPACLCFHHLRDKRVIFGQAASRRSVKREVEKCVVMCHNCHSKGHAGRPRAEHILFFPSG